MSNARNKAHIRAIQSLSKKAELKAAQIYVEGILKGNRALLSEAITLIESQNNRHRELADAILSACVPYAGNSVRIGITGVPGVGKSTFIETFGTTLTAQGQKVAVLAIDPSSSISKGSILGDKTRMEKLSVDENAFIRPSPAADTLGGVARKTKESLLLCEAAGYNYILIETVGVGQSETAVHEMTDFFLLLMLSGAGDQLQGIKRGIMEMCDALVITKADGENKKMASKAMAEYKSALHFYPPKESGWMPKVASCSALENEGITPIISIIDEYMTWNQERGMIEKKRMSQDIQWLENSLKEKILYSYFSNDAFQLQFTALKLKIEAKEITPFQAADVLVKNFLP